MSARRPGRYRDGERARPRPLACQRGKTMLSLEGVDLGEAAASRGGGEGRCQGGSLVPDSGQRGAGPCERQQAGLQGSLELRQAFARRAGFSWSRVRILLWLRWEGETRHSELRQRLGADGATVTPLVKQFESEGLLSRRPDPADNRYTLAALTKAGQAAAGEVERSHRRFQQQLLAGVAEHDRQAVLRVLRQFRANATTEET